MYTGFIYRHWIINDDNKEKSYIGQIYSTHDGYVKDPHERWRLHGKGYGPKDEDDVSKFWRAICKYGWDNFHHDILFKIECNTLDDLRWWLNDWECYYIWRYDSYYNGYNGTPGGNYNKPSDGPNRDEWKRKISEARIGHEVLPETRAKISKTLKELPPRVYTQEELEKRRMMMTGDKNPNYGKPVPEERKEKARATWKTKYDNGYINPSKGKPKSEEHKRKISETMKGKPVSEETKKKIGDAQRGAKSSRAKAVICLEDEKMFTTAKEASIYYNCQHSKIIACCKNKRNYTGTHPTTGEHLHWMYYDEYLKSTQEEILLVKSRKPVPPRGGNCKLSKKVVCLETKHVFNSSKEAKEWCGTDPCGNLKGRNKSAGKHPETGEPLHWMYFDEYEMLTKEKELKN